jgi:sugar O-acyltransferase (sialic acid O-acetyltransferase NeuD family)
MTRHVTDRAGQVVFWGATGQSRVLRECVAAQDLQLVALFDDTEGLEPPFPDVPLYHGRTAFERWLVGIADPSAVAFLVAIGGEHGIARVRIHRYLEGFGLRPATAVHRTAFVADDVVLGPGSQVLAQSAIGVGSRLGTDCIINTSSTVDHECVLGDGVHIAGGARLAGCVRIDDYATVFTGAVVLPRVRIGEGAVVGAGAVVLDDVEPWSVVVGNPARAIGRRTPQRP